MTRFGTSHFVSFQLARAYYRPYGFTGADVNTKIREGEIHIGRPECKPGESIVLVDGGTRYAIEAPEPSDKAPAAAAPAI